MWLREGPCTTEGEGQLAWQMQDHNPVLSCLPVHGYISKRALPPPRTSPTAGQDHKRWLRLFLCWQKWSCPLGALPPGRAVRIALDHHFWTGFGVDQQLFGSWITLILTSHLCPICTGTRKVDTGTSIMISTYTNNYWKVLMTSAASLKNDGTTSSWS